MRPHLEVQSSAIETFGVAAKQVGKALVRVIAMGAVTTALFIVACDAYGLREMAEPRDPAEELLTGAALGDEAMWSDGLSSGASINARSFGGNTPLILAADCGDARLIGRLIAAGADVAAVSDHNVTPLAMAAIHGRVEIMRTLLEAGAATNQLTIRHGTALHLAASQGEKAAMELLIRRGADVNARDQDGNTPLMALAYFRGADADCARMLIAAGADMNVVNDQGEDAPSIAKLESRDDLAALYIR